MEKHREVLIFCEQERCEKLYILFVDDVITSSLLVLENHEVSYIAMLDSTGISRGYTQAMVMSIIENMNGLVVCFSHPKDELIFRKTELKNVMGPRKLFDFWKHIFGNRCKNCNGQGCYLQTWSNFESSRGFPYKSIDEIRCFPDDPKGRLIQSLRGCAITIQDLFDGLLVGADFAKGGLIFSFCGNRKVLQGPSRRCTESVPSQDSMSRIKRMIEVLRQMDFSTYEAALRSSKDFVSQFSISAVRLQPVNHARIKKEATDAHCLKVVPRKR